MAQLVEWNSSPLVEGGKAIALNCTTYWGTGAGDGAAPAADGRATITDPAAMARAAEARCRMAIMCFVSSKETYSMANAANLCLVTFGGGPVVPVSGTRSPPRTWLGTRFTPETSLHLPARPTSHEACRGRSSYPQHSSTIAIAASCGLRPDRGHGEGARFDPPRPRSSMQ